MKLRVLCFQPSRINHLCILANVLKDIWVSSFHRNSMVNVVFLCHVRCISFWLVMLLHRCLKEWLIKYGYSCSQTRKSDGKKRHGRGHKDVNARWHDELKSFFKECASPGLVLASSLCKIVPGCWVSRTSHNSYNWPVCLVIILFSLWGKNLRFVKSRL